MLRNRFVAVTFGALVLFAACAQDEDPSLTEPDQTTEATEAPAADGTVAVTDNDELGEILTDADGRTLYVFLNDEGGESTCADACAQTWPPLAADGEPTAGEGVDAELLGTTERDDGDMQVTYNDRPLYHYATDEAPGDTNGQGVGDRWYVVGPDGEPIED